MIGMMDKGGGTQQQIPPKIQSGMNNLPPDVVAKLQGITPPPAVDPLSYSDPTNTPDPMIEAIKAIMGTFGYGPNANPKGR